jgi:hypothetical protein
MGIISNIRAREEKYLISIEEREIQKRSNRSDHQTEPDADHIVRRGDSPHNTRAMPGTQKKRERGKSRVPFFVII